MNSTARGYDEIDAEIHAIIIRAGKVIGTNEIRDSTDIYYQRVTYSLIRLVAQGVIFEHGRTLIDGKHQNAFALWPKSSMSKAKIDKHILSECWPTKIFVPSGTARRPHRPLLDSRE